MHRLLAQNREMLVMIQKLMTQVSDKHAKEFSEPLNESWMLSELSPAATVLNSNSNLFHDPSGGLGTKNIDFDSQIFDNLNIGDNGTRSKKSVTVMSPNKLTFDDMIGQNHAIGGTTPNGDLNTTLNLTTDSKDTNPFSAAPPIHYKKKSLNNSINTTLNSTSANTDARNNNVTDF